MERTHLLLTNGSAHSKAALLEASSILAFFDAKDLLSSLDSSLHISNTLKVSKCALKYLRPVADLSAAQEQPFLLADADAGNSALNPH